MLRILEKPYNSVSNGSLWMLLFNLILPLFGVVFLKWDVFSILYLFWIELIMLGIITFLKVLFSIENNSFITGLLSRLLFLVGFSILFIGFLMIVISYSMASFDLGSYYNSNNYQKGLGVGMIMLVLAMLTDFAFHFILNNKYKKYNFMVPVIKTMIYAIPLACAIVFVVLPMVKKFEGQNRNMLMVIGIIIAKTLVEYVLNWLSFIQNRSNKQIIN